MVSFGFGLSSGCSWMLVRKVPLVGCNTYFYKGVSPPTGCFLQAQFLLLLITVTLNHKKKTDCVADSHDPSELSGRALPPGLLHRRNAMLHRGGRD
jgi:hypothetical protein